MSNGDDLLLFVCLVAVIVWGFAVFLKGFLLFRKKRLIENLPISWIRSLAMGLVKVRGEVITAEGIMRSPFFLKECVYYMYEIQRFKEQQHPFGYGREEMPEWKTVKTGSDSVKFILQDETGSVLVDPAEADMRIAKGLEWNIDRENLPSAEVEEFLAFHDIPREDPEGREYRMRYREYFIEQGDEVYVVGTAGKNPLTGEAGTQSNAGNIMIQQGVEKGTYIISDSTEEDFIKNLGIAYRIKIIGGALISLLSLLFLLFFMYYTPG